MASKQHKQVEMGKFTYLDVVVGRNEEGQGTVTVKSGDGLHHGHIVCAHLELERRANRLGRAGD